MLDGVTPIVFSQMVYASSIDAIKIFVREDKNCFSEVSERCAQATDGLADCPWNSGVSMQHGHPYEHTGVLH